MAEKWRTEGRDRGDDNSSKGAEATNQKLSGKLYKQKEQT